MSDELQDKNSQELLSKITKAVEGEINKHDKISEDKYTSKIKGVIENYQKRNKKLYIWTIIGLFTIFSLITFFIIFYFSSMMKNEIINEELKADIKRTITAKEQSTLLTVIERDFTIALGAHRKHIKNTTKYRWHEWDRKMVTETSKNITEGWFYRHVQPELICAIVASESYYRRNAVSSSKAKGVSQIIKPTWDELIRNIHWEKMDIWDPADNIKMAIKHIDYIQNMGYSYFTKYNKDWYITDTAGSYNSGFLYYYKWRRKIENNSYKLYEETSKYKIKVHWYYTNYLNDNWDAVWKEQHYKQYNLDKVRQGKLF